MSKYQYSSILVRYSKDSQERYTNVSNLTDEDEDGFVEFDTAYYMRHVSPWGEETIRHIKTKCEIVEFVELV